MFSRIRTLCCDRDFQASNTTHTTHRCSQKQAPLMHDRLHAYIHTHHTQHTQHMLHLALARRTSVEEHLRVKGLPTLLSFICPCCGLNIPLCISAFPLDGGCIRVGNSAMCASRGPKQKTPLCISASWNQNIDGLMFGVVSQSTLTTDGVPIDYPRVETSHAWKANPDRIK